MKLEDYTFIFINILLLVLFETLVLTIAWLIGEIAGADVNYTLIGGVAFVIWALFAVIVALGYVKMRREESDA